MASWHRLGLESLSTAKFANRRHGRFPNRPYDGRLFFVGAVRERPVTVETALRVGVIGRAND